MATPARQLYICLDNSGYKASLERRKIYIALSDPKAEKLGQLRIKRPNYAMQRSSRAGTPLAVTGADGDRLQSASGAPTARRR